MEQTVTIDGASHRLALRLARDAADLAAVQRLRWQVFYEEMGASAEIGAAIGLDADPFDDLCDHLLVIDRDAAQGEAVIGTYRLLRENIARAHGGFYSADEFEIGMLGKGAAGRGELLELGRSCVLPPYRTSATISLLWRGIGDYIARHRIALLFGCASFPGTEAELHAAALSYLFANHLAPEELRPRVHPARAARWTALDPASYDPRRALLAMPPLVKAYLRVGAMVGDGAFVDHAFNTVDVCVVMPVEKMSERYAARFSVAA